MKRFIKGFLATVVLISFSGLYSAEAQTTYTIGGSVSGLLSGKSVTLLNNGSDPLVISSNGSFVFSNSQAAGPYAVTVAIQPAGQSCSVTNGSGPSISSNVTDVNVTCSGTFTVGGTVSGLAAPGLVLKLNNSATKIIASGASSYAFSTSLPNGAAYAVSVGIQPAGYSCTVTNGTGTIGGSVTNANVNCEKTYSVGGSISGLTASGLILKLNGTGTKIVSNGAGSYVFSTALTSGTNYAVTIQTQPSGLTCLVLNGSGIISNNVTDANISCTVNTYTVGGTVSGLGTGLSLTLLNNGGNAVTVNESGSLSFTFSPALVSGAAYDVTVGTQPSGQTCTVTGGSGNIGTTDVSVSVTCTTVGTPLNATIVLGTPTTDSIAMKLFTPDQNGSISVSYGTSTGNYSTTTPPVQLVAGTPLALNLSGLSDNTQYFYRINYQSSSGNSQTPEYKFHTARPAGDTFTFAIQADPHMDEKTEVALYQRTLNNIASDSPDFLIDLGDTFMTEKHQVQLEATVHAATSQAMVNLRYQSDLPYFGILSHSVPLFLVNGNHDAELGWLATSNSIDHSLPTWAYNARQAYFPNPIKNNFYDGESVSLVSTAPRASYYSWKWGDALFIALDPFFNSATATGKTSSGWNLTLGKAQYDWLAATLAANAGIKYKFVFLHNLVGGLPEINTTTGLPDTNPATGTPYIGGSMRGGIEAAKYFEWGGKNYDGSSEGFAANRPGWAQPIHQLLLDNNVTAVFHGHDHLYVDQELDGIKYQETPQPSAGSTSNSATLSKEGGYLSGTMDSSSGYLKVTVSPTGVTSRYVRSWLPAGTAGTNNVENGTTKVNKQVSQSWTVTPGSTAKYAVGGTVSGLTGTLTLANNGINALTLFANGPFNFSKILPTGSAYSVTVTGQPVGQTCSVSNATGTISTSNISNITVNCTANTFTVGGTISGHTGTVTLTNNGGNAINIPAGTTVFTFPGQNYGTNWDVEVASSPAGETCSVSSNGVGSNITADISNITVTCGSSAHTVGGTVTGLASGLSVRLLNNSGDDLTVSANGVFTFATPLVSGAPYSVSVGTQPVGQTCLVTSGSGTMGNANVTSVGVICAANSYTVGGTISGLGSGLSITLQNNLGDDLTITNSNGFNGFFTFPTPLSSGNYSVTVKTSPTEQTCTVTNGSGTNISANVSNVTVACVTNTYTMQVRVSGLNNGMGTGLNLALNINGSQASTMTVPYGTLNNANLKFTPDIKYASGTAYAVLITQQPVDSNGTNRPCIVTNGIGTVSGANISVSVTCSTTTGLTVGGTVTGLSGPMTLTLSSSATASTATVNLVAGSGGFTFAALGSGATATFIPTGATYTVTAGTPPAGQSCTVTNGSGTMGTSSVTNVSIVCAYNGYTVGGTISGHNGTVILTNNGLNAITLNTGTGSFNFPAQLFGTSYNVTVSSAPSGQSCNVVNGSGTNISANITNVIVTCFNTYTVGGSVSGLTGSVTLLNNGVNPTTVSANGNFTLSNTMLNGATYNIVVQSQPDGQTCLVFNASGSIAGSNITNVLVSCTTNTYTVGGNVSGLANGQSIVLFNNSGNALTVSANGTFTFTTPLAAGPYIVTVGTQPAGQTCSVTNGSGNVSTSNITSVVVTCTNNIGGCSSPANASAPGSDPFWAIYSSPTLPDAETTPALDSEQSNPFEACLGSG